MPTVETFEDLGPVPRLPMGPRPFNFYPRVLRVMSPPIQGQFEPHFRRYMTQTMALRQRYRLPPACVDGPASGLEAMGLKPCGSRRPRGAHRC